MMMNGTGVRMKGMDERVVLLIGCKRETKKWGSRGVDGGQSVRVGYMVRMEGKV